MTETPDMARQRRMERRALEFEQQKLIRTLITPEGAALKLKLAAAGERAGAFLIDFTLIILVAIAGLIALGMAANSFGFEGGEIALALAMLFIFALRNFYFVFFELGRRAATPGKRILGLRVAARNGGRLTANAIFARNFVREVEVFLPLGFLLQGAGGSGLDSWISLLALIWSGLFLFFPMFNADKLRVGDIIAGTWVIHAPKVKLQGDIANTSNRAPGTSASAGFTFTPEQLDTYGIHELHVLEDVLRQATPEVRASVAGRIREKIGWASAPGETDLAFLNAYYAALRRQLEQKLLLGKRKTDKFDKT